MPPRVCAGMTWRLIAAGTMQQWRPRLEEANREARQFGVGVRGGVKQVALRARVHHEARNWLILTDCSNAFNTVKRTAMVAEAATFVPALNTVRGKMLQRGVCARVLSDGIGRKAEDRLLQRGTTT